MVCRTFPTLSVLLSRIIWHKIDTALARAILKHQRTVHEALKKYMNRQNFFAFLRMDIILNDKVRCQPASRSHNNT